MAIRRAFWVPSFSDRTAKRFVGERERERESARWSARVGHPIGLPVVLGPALPGCLTFLHILPLTSTHGSTFTGRLLQEPASLALLKLKQQLLILFQYVTASKSSQSQRFLNNKGHKTVSSALTGDGTSSPRSRGTHIGWPFGIDCFFVPDV